MPQAATRDSTGHNLVSNVIYGTRVLITWLNCMVSRIYAEMGFALESQEDGFSELHFKDIEQQHYF